MLNLPWLTRRVLLVGAAVVLVLAVVVTVVQVRAAQAEERRDVAAQAAADAEREAAEAAEAERLADEQAALEEDWAHAVAEAETQIAAAEATLAGSAGRVADEAPRVALTEAVAAVRTLVDAGVTTEAPDALRAAVSSLTPMMDAVTQAAESWQAAEEARLAAEAQAEADAAAAAQRQAAPPALGGPPSTGAGPDCGGPESYEPPENDGPVFYTSTPSSSGDGSNGRIPADRMTALSWCQDSQGNKQWLRSDAAAALTRLNDAFRAQFGENIAVDLSYRSYETQVAMREAYGSLAARPGTSNHGTGVAIDTWEWAAYSFGSARYDWLVANGPGYGWVAPDWARQGGSNPEYWHFEYVG